MINITPIYTLISVFVLVAVVLVIFLVRKNPRQQRLSILAGVSFFLLISSIVFSEQGSNVAIGYSLMGLGVVFAAVDLLVKFKKKR